MTDLPPLREIIARHGLRANKALGQNFLLDSQLLDRIAAVPGGLEGRCVYEVGPGPGGLTRALLRAGARVVAVERDSRCLAALGELAETSDGRLTVFEGDALTIDEAALPGSPACIVANLPYNIATPLLVKWLGTEWPPWWRSMTLMFQREVAERICAAPGDKAYGRLSVLAQWRSAATLCFTVNRAAFVPPPKVTSAVIHLEPRAAPAGVELATLERVTQAAFGQRRKMLRGSLKPLPEALEALDSLGIDPKRRAETLQVDDFVAIARQLTA